MPFRQPSRSARRVVDCAETGRAVHQSMPPLSDRNRPMSLPSSLPHLPTRHNRLLDASSFNIACQGGRGERWLLLLLLLLVGLVPLRRVWSGGEVGGANTSSRHRRAQGDRERERGGFSLSHAPSDNRAATYIMSLRGVRKKK